MVSRETYRGVPVSDKTADCIVEGCTNKQKTRNLCGTHYNVWLSGRDPHSDYKHKTGTKPVRNPVEGGRKRCTKCGEVKTQKNYYVRSDGYIYPHCKDCHAVMTKIIHDRNQAKREEERRNNPKPPKVFPKCDGPECDRDAFGNQKYCHTHYNQLHRGSELKPIGRYKDDITDTHKKCKGCNQWLLLRNYHRSRGTFQPYCKMCQLKINGVNRHMKAGRFDEAMKYVETMHEPVRTLYLNKLQDKMSEE